MDLYLSCDLSNEEASTEIAAIPAPLLELAEALLKHRHADAAILNSLLEDNPELVADAV